MSIYRAGACALLVSGTVLWTGCGGHGKYTQEHLNLAENRMTELKSASEWDLGHSAFMAGDLDKSLKHVEKSLSLNPDVAKSHVLRGRILLEMGQLDEANNALAEGARLDPENVEAPYYQGIVAERMMQKDLALEHFMRASELDPTNPQYVVAVSDVFIEMDQLDQAEQYLIDRADRFKHDPGVNQSLGHIAMMRGDTEHAQEHFFQAHLLAPDDDPILEDLVRAQFANGEFGEAEYNLSHMLDAEDAPDRRDLQHMRARCLLALNRHLDARQILLDLTKGNQGASDVEAWVGLGEVAYKMKDNANLRDAAWRVQSLAPDRSEGYLYHSLFHRRQGNHHASVDAAHQAHQRAPEDITVLTVLALGQIETGDYAQAQQTLARANEIDPANPAVSQMRGLLERQATYATVPTD